MAKPTTSRNAGATMRLMVLGLLKRYGPNHGHAMRQFIRNAHVDEWTDVQPGSLYYALEQLAKENLIVTDRIEQVGQRPPRTIYRITEAGEQEIERLIISLLQAVRPANDPVNLALLFSSTIEDVALAGMLRVRVDALQEQLEASRQGREHSVASGLIGPRGAEIFRHLEMQLEADIAWHEQFIVKLMAGEAPTLPAGELTARHALFGEKGDMIPDRQR